MHLLEPKRPNPSLKHSNKIRMWWVRFKAWRSGGGCWSSKRSHAHCCQEDDLDGSDPFANNEDLEDNETVIDNNWLGCKSETLNSQYLRLKAVEQCVQIMERLLLWIPEQLFVVVLTKLSYYISVRTQAYNNLDTDQNARYKWHKWGSFILSL